MSREIAMDENIMFRVCLTAKDLFMMTSPALMMKEKSKFLP